MESPDITEFTQPGLYLRFPNGESLVLTSQSIEDRAQALLSDPTRIPVHVREAEAFQLCSICPKKG